MAHPPKIQAILDDLAFFPDRADRIQALIALADGFTPVAEAVAVRPFDEAHRVPGCESEAFVWVTSDGAGSLRTHFAVENPQGISAMALATILPKGLDGEPVAVAGLLQDDLIYDLFGRELSMGKSMGLMGMVRMTRYLAGRLASAE